MNGLTKIVKLNEQGQTSEVAQAEAILAKHREAGTALPQSAEVYETPATEENAA